MIFMWWNAKRLPERSAEMGRTQANELRERIERIFVAEAIFDVPGSGAHLPSRQAATPH
jgi:hypothetical protein